GNIRIDCVGRVRRARRIIDVGFEVGNTLFQGGIGFLRCVGGAGRWPAGREDEGDEAAEGESFHGWVYIAFSPRSSVRIRTISSMLETKTLPSPIFPVLAERTIALTTSSTLDSWTTISILILGSKSTVYSLPR